MTQLQQMKARLVWLEAKEGVEEETTCWILVLMERFCIIKGNWVKGYTGSF